MVEVNFGSAYTAMSTWAAKAARMTNPVAKAVMIKALVLTCLNLAVWLVLTHSLCGVRCRFFSVVLFATLVPLASCSSTDQQKGVSAPIDTQVTLPPDLRVSTSALVEKVGTEVPVALTVLERPTISGELFEPVSLAGREVLLWFWAPW